jgi:hypothetical protein
MTFHRFFAGVSLASTVLFASSGLASAATPAAVKGKILLQVEEHGEAWYVTPDTGERFYLKNGEGAYAALRNFGLGITNADIWKIPVANYHAPGDNDFTGDTDKDGFDDNMEQALGTDVNKADTDGDGYSDSVEYASGNSPFGSSKIPVDSGLVNRLKGKIVLQVEGRGEAWYINPADGKRYYMANGDVAYSMMRYMSLGITNANLSPIPVYSKDFDCGGSVDCMIGAVEAGTPFHGTFLASFELFGSIEGKYRFEYQPPKTVGGSYTSKNTVLEQRVNGQDFPQAVGVTNTCTGMDTAQLVVYLEQVKTNTFTTDTTASLDCVATEPE